MHNLGIIPKCKFDDVNKCDICVQGKITCKPHKSVMRTSELLGLIHSDVADRHSKVSLGGSKYFVTFIDDFSKYAYVYLLKSKDEVLSKFLIYKAVVENQLNRKIKVLHSDKGGEY